MTMVYETLGVRTIINAKGPSTRLSGGLMRPEVTEAMREAAQHCVDMAALQGRACEIIAEATGAEAGFVTSGAAAGLLLGTAACITGLHPGRMNRLPDTAGMKNEVVVVRSQRNFYDHAVRTAGARLVEVGLPDRYSGAGIRDAEAWEIADAIGERTAAVLYVAAPQSRPTLAEVLAVAHAAQVPVLVDAAAQLPPAANLRRFIAEGADLVAFSGGKEIGGPQASGILCGRRDLIMAAALQQLDLDIAYHQWAPPASLIDKHRLPGLPHHGIGRPCKVGKEQIVGLLTALRFFLAESDASRRERWMAIATPLAEALRRIGRIEVRLRGGNDEGDIPEVELEVDPGRAGLGAQELVTRLQNGDPSVHADPSRVSDGIVVLAPTCLRADQVPLVVDAVRRCLS